MWKQFRLLQATCKRTYLSSKNITRSLWPRVVARWTGDQPSRFVLLMSAPNSTNSFAESILPSRMHWCNAVSPASFNALIFKPLLSSRWTSSRSFLFTASWKALCFSLVSIKDAFVSFCLCIMHYACDCVNLQCFQWIFFARLALSKSSAASIASNEWRDGVMQGHSSDSILRTF